MNRRLLAILLALSLLLTAAPAAQAEAAQAEGAQAAPVETAAEAEPPRRKHGLLRIVQRLTGDRAEAKPEAKAEKAPEKKEEAPARVLSPDETSEMMIKTAANVMFCELDGGFFPQGVPVSFEGETQVNGEKAAYTVDRL